MGPRTAPIEIPGQGYGEQAAQVRAQQAVPAGTQPVPPPRIMERLTAPTERPDEPFQHGLPTGPGAGPEVLGLTETPPSAALRSWLVDHPYDEDVREVIELLEATGQ